MSHGPCYGIPTGDAGTDAVLREIRRDERSHSLAVNDMLTAAPYAETSDNVVLARQSLDSCSQARTHKTGSGWVSDAIYGANDGPGCRVWHRRRRIRSYRRHQAQCACRGPRRRGGASALSMGVGAWLAATAPPNRDP